MTQGKSKGLAALFRPTVKKPERRQARTEFSEKGPTPAVDVVELLKSNTYLQSENAILRKRVEWYEARYGKVSA